MLLAKIDKFTGMSDDGGIFFNEGFLPTMINGKSVIEDTFQCNSIIETTTTGFSDLQNIISGTSYVFSRIGNNYGFIFIDTGGQIFVKNFFSLYDGKIHGVATTGDTIYGFGDVLQTANGNILYSSANELGIGYIGQCKSGSGTTKIVDKDGRNFSTLGIVVGEANHNKITNLRTGVEYTITGISNQDATNDAVTFTASGTNDNLENDYFIVWIDDKFNMFDNTAYPQFLGQVAKGSIRRQIEPYGDSYYCLNGNFLSELSANEDTFDDNKKQLPARHQALAFDVNGGNFLISSTRDGVGYLLFWDGFSDGWNNILEIDEQCYAVHAYKDGWVFFMNNSFYFTNGWQIQQISSPYPDDRVLKSNFSINPGGFCSIYINSDRFYITNSVYLNNRIISGVLVYDQKYGWSVFTAEKNGRNRYKDYQTSCIFESNIDRLTCIGGIGINLLDITGYTTSIYRNKALMFYLQFDNNVNVSHIELDVSNNLRRYIAGSETSPRKAKIQVSIGDVKDGIIGRAQLNASGHTTTKLDVNGSVFIGAKVGDEIQLQEGVASGERSFITNITDAGTANELWTISPALSEAPNSFDEVKIIKVKHCETKIIDGDKLNEPIRFDCKGTVGTKMILEVVVHGYSDTGYSSFPVSINSIKIYG